MWSKWPDSCYFVGCCFLYLFKKARIILGYFPSRFFYLVSRWCNHTIVLRQPKPGRNPVLFYLKDHFQLDREPSHSSPRLPKYCVSFACFFSIYVKSKYLPTPSATSKSILKRSTTVLNSEFSFFKTGCLSKIDMLILMRCKYNPHLKVLLVDFTEC